MLHCIVFQNNNDSLTLHGGVRLMHVQKREIEREEKGKIEKVKDVIGMSELEREKKRRCKNITREKKV